ncbi:unnamed protein product [Spirodela intermedia]|uniref:Uncharacterized protein n=1 Tax=Spirodela intermedia TaxID=51605 RepID=A0A7I8J7B6_SPIIN|nr:unnamed protein product [Spirodela intermedia]CAA6665303.1 unnamed protein product [Spirodela intermedia]
MERIPAACAMNWSIELEKGIRSRRQGHPEEVIEQIGPRLLSWSRESCATLSASKMYDLIPGEERSFANTILTRLVDAFRSGNNRMRSSILKVFLLELKHIKDKGKRYNGILSKKRLPNYLELLKRLWLVFDTGDVEARALSLRLLGCWAPLTHDNADVQNIVISSLQSKHVLEVKASLFACGCLSILSEDFVRIILGILVDVFCSVTVPLDVKFATARAFGEIQCSSLLACRAYKSGKNLVQGVHLEGYRIELLSSLTRLAVKSVILIPEQVDFLLTFMVEGCSSVTKSMTLKCVRFLCFRGFSHFSAKGNVLSILMDRVNDPELPLALQCDVLKTLRQLFSDLPKVCHEDTPQFRGLVMCVQLASQSPHISKRYLSLGFLVDIVCNTKRARKGNYSCTEKLSLEYVKSQSQVSTDEFPAVNGADSLLKDVFLLLLDDIASVLNKSDNGTMRKTEFVEDTGWCDNGYDIKQKYRILSNYVLRLVKGCPALSVVVLSRFRSLIEDMVSQMEIELDKSNPSFESQDYAQDVPETIISCIRCFVIPCLNLLDENGQTGTEVCAVVELLMDSLQKVDFCNYDPLEMVYFRLFSLISRCETSGRMQMICSSDAYLDPNISEDIFKKMMTRNKYWMVYKAGKYSLTEGLWFAATYAFKNLIAKAKSDSCRSWLKCLMLFSGAETEIRLLLFPEHGAKLVNELCFDIDRERPHEGIEERMGSCEGGIGLMHMHREKLSRVHRRICSSQEILSVVGTQKGGFWFQNWFLNLRGKGLEILLELLGHLDSCSRGEGNLNKHVPSGKKLPISSSLSTDDVDFLSSKLSYISLQFNKLAREYDFMIVSFMDMDIKSYALISRLALYFSLLAYCTGFPLYFCDSSGSHNTASNLGRFENPSGLLLLEDLSGRLFEMDCESDLDLKGRLPFSGCLSSRDTDTLSVCRFATCGIHHLLKEAKEDKSREEFCDIFSKGLHLLNTTLVKWMGLPSQIPRYFFRLGDCIGAELFLLSDQTRNSNELCILVGNQLCLHLCIQMRNISPVYRGRIYKIYCILTVESPKPVPEGKKSSKVLTGFQQWKTEETMNIYELLMLHMRNEAEKRQNMRAVPTDDVDLVTAYVCVEPNTLGQGFSTCLLDVSDFPEGVYQIRWHSCCVDKSDHLWSLPAFNNGIPFTVRCPV